MKEMSTLKFPNQEEPYEIVDAAAREEIVNLVPYLESKINDKAPLEHAHDYLPLSGGTVNGNLGVTGTITLGNAVFTYDSTNKRVVISVN